VEPAWFLAHTLAERLRAGEPSGAVDDGLGRKRLALWRDEPVHRKDPDRVGDRYGLTEAALVRLLGETPEAVRSRFDTDPWYAQRIAEAWRRYPATGHALPGFAPLAGPLLHQARERVRNRVAALADGHPRLSTGVLADQLGDGPVEAVNQLAARTLVLELNVARLRGELAGADPHERYHHFVRLLADPAYSLGVLREYPVLARDLVRTVDNWAESRLEFVERLVADFDQLAVHCGGPDALGDLAGVTFGAGDSHRGGRSVAVVRFETGAWVMYKPRRLGVDRHFQDLLVWLNERGDHPPLRTFWVMDRRDYGWTEFVAAGPCADRAAVGRFYRRQGAYLALLHTLGAVDFHLENIIAAGEHPVLIDLEALFHSWQVRLPEGDEAAALMSRSVIAVGLLPAPALWSEDNQVNQFDLSGMSGAGGQLTLTPVPTWDDAGSDEMRLVRRRVAMPGSANLPTVDGSLPDVTEFRDDLVEGYRSMYRTLLRNREALAGPLSTFADDEVRIVVRPTRVYMKMLDEGRHPDLLRDALDRDRFYDNLFSGHQGRRHRDGLIASELAQLLAGDVPIFLTTPSTTDLAGGDAAVLPGMLERTGLDVARERLAGLSEGHLAQQTWFIEASLTALVMGDPTRWGPQSTVDRPAVPEVAAADRYTAAASRIGDRLLETAIVEADRIGWLGLNLVADKVWTLNAAGIDLYNGISGIGLFLGYLAGATGNPAHRQAAERVADMVSRQAEAWMAAPGTPPVAADLGAFGRLGGAVYALSHLAAVLDRDDLAATAVRLADLMVPLVEQDRAFDVVSGSAGGILAVLSLHAVRPEPALLDLARAMAGHLLDTAERTGTGLAWRGEINAAAPLAGFSHGASGIATALARLDRRTGSTAYRGAVRAALHFERTMVDERTGNWRDARTDVPTSDIFVAWCHGAGGVGLARSDLLGYLEDDPTVRRELRQAAEATDRMGFQGLHNHSICHGYLGNSEALLVAAGRLGDRHLARQAGIRAATVLADVEERAWRCGVPLGVETPGLMSGLAGIGYGLLRFSDPGSIPSVLLLEKPRDKSSCHPSAIQWE
jgi:type 2 lantibiotic biosynthesis protein LanM